jgi:hypothetical protein
MGNKSSKEKTDESACFHQISRLPEELQQLLRKTYGSHEKEFEKEFEFKEKLGELKRKLSFFKTENFAKLCQDGNLSDGEYQRGKDDILHEVFGCDPYFLREGEDEFHLDFSPALAQLADAFNDDFAERANKAQTKKDLERRPKESLIGDDYLEWVKEYLRTDDEELCYQLLGLLVETCSGAVHASLMHYRLKSEPGQSPLKLNELLLKRFLRGDNHGELFFHQESGPGPYNKEMEEFGFGFKSPPTFLITFSIRWRTDDDKHISHSFHYKKCVKIE